jgi:hypothetical protein
VILDSERPYLLEMRSLATDAEGREVLVGLNFEETAFYLAHVGDVSHSIISVLRTMNGRPNDI